MGNNNSNNKNSDEKSNQTMIENANRITKQNAIRKANQNSYRVIRQIDPKIIRISNQNTRSLNNQIACRNGRDTIYENDADLLKDWEKSKDIHKIKNRSARDYSLYGNVQNGKQIEMFNDLEKGLSMPYESNRFTSNQPNLSSEFMDESITSEDPKYIELIICTEDSNESHEERFAINKFDPDHLCKGNCHCVMELWKYQHVSTIPYSETSVDDNQSFSRGGYNKRNYNQSNNQSKNGSRNKSKNGSINRSNNNRYNNESNNQSENEFSDEQMNTIGGCDCNQNGGCDYQIGGARNIVDTEDENFEDEQDVTSEDLNQMDDGDDSGDTEKLDEDDEKETFSTTDDENTDNTSDTSDDMERNNDTKLKKNKKKTNKKINVTNANKTNVNKTNANKTNAAKFHLMKPTVMQNNYTSKSETDSGEDIEDLDGIEAEDVNDEDDQGILLNSDITSSDLYNMQSRIFTSDTDSELEDDQIDKKIKKDVNYANLLNDDEDVDGALSSESEYTEKLTNAIKELKKQKQQNRISNIYDSEDKHIMDMNSSSEKYKTQKLKKNSKYH